MRSRTWLATAAACALALGTTACGSSDKKSSSSTTSGGGSATLNGAGSTFAAPIYQQVGSELKGDGLTINYAPTGSGAGVAQFATGTVNFAGSDPSLTPDDVKTLKKGAATQIPFAFGAITVSYNLSGVATGLKLDGQTIADIYLGKVKRWNDPEIASQNAGTTLPADDITVVHRSDSSGTTKGFTQFLADYSKVWAKSPGVDKEVKWPTGTGAQGNDGVAAAVKQTAGSIGYVEAAYALQNNFTFASVKNSSGKYTAPVLAATSAAGDGIKIPKDLGISVINSPNPTAYPISSQTFVIVYTDLCKAGLSKGDAAGMITFLNYLVSDKGQATIKKLSYAPVPAGLIAKDQAAIGALTCNGAPAAG